MGVAQQARGFDAAVEHVAGLRELATLPPHATEYLDEDEKVLSLSRGPRHRQCAGGVGVGIGVAIEVELHPGEARSGVKVAGQLLVRQRLEEGDRLLTVAFPSLGRLPSSTRRVRAWRARQTVRAGSPTRLAAFTARCAVSCIASYFVRKNSFTASSVMSATASGES